jgi:hypothetical protein
MAFIILSIQIPEGIRGRFGRLADIVGERGGWYVRLKRYE